MFPLSFSNALWSNKTEKSNGKKMIFISSSVGRRVHGIIILLSLWVKLWAALNACNNNKSFMASQHVHFPRIAILNNSVKQPESQGIFSFIVPANTMGQILSCHEPVTLHHLACSYSHLHQLRRLNVFI